MSDVSIKDGTGDCNRAKVDSNRRLHNRGVIDSKFVNLVSTGRAHSTATGVIDLTSSTTSVVAYLKNTGDSDLIVAGFTISSTKSQELTGTVNPQGSILVEILTGFTAHTLTTAITPIPLKSNNAITLEATILSGAEGDTVTGGISFSDTFVQHGTIYSSAENSEAPFFFPKDTEIAIRVTPPSGTAVGNDKIQISFSTIIYTSDGDL